MRLQQAGGALLVSTETSVIDASGVSVIGSRRPFLKKRTLHREIR